MLQEIKKGDTFKVNDDHLMPFGKHKQEGKTLGQVPDSYWKWFERQDWAHEWPNLLEYAQLLVEDD